MTTKQAIEKAGYGIKEHIGGLPRKTYYTPDGRVIKAIPSIRNFRRLVDGKWEDGSRDANYDRGWLAEMPKELKLYCQGCDEWHGTDEEVEKCIALKAVAAKKWEAFAKRLKKEDSAEKDEEITSLKNDVQELKDMVSKLLEGK